MFLMKITLRDLQLIYDEKTYPVDIAAYPIKDNIFLKEIRNVQGDITFYVTMDELRVNYVLKGTMICPDALTLEDAEVDFDLSQDEKVVYGIDEDGFYFPGTMDAEELVSQIVIPEAPIKVVKNKKIEYSKGDGWSFVSEEDYESSREDEIDPRLQKLKEYKMEEDE